MTMGNYNKNWLHFYVLLFIKNVFPQTSELI